MSGSSLLSSRGLCLDTPGGREPSDSLDFLGATALASLLAAWPGGLVVVSHDDDLLGAIGIERRLDLG